MKRRRGLLVRGSCFCALALFFSAAPPPARALVAWEAGAMWATNAQALGATGTSVRIGIVEADAEAGENYTYRIDPAYSNGTRTGILDGKTITYHDPGTSLFTNYSWHAGGTAMYSVGNYSSSWGKTSARGFAPGCTNIGNYPADYFINNYMASNVAPDEKVCSFAFTTTTDAQVRLTAEVDQMVDTYNKVFVQGVRPRPAVEAYGGDHPAGMGVAYNAITVGACDADFTNHATSQYGPSRIFGTAKPDLLSGNISESEATARGAGAAVMLLDQADRNGWTNGQDSRVIKAILLAGARKTGGWDKGEDGGADDHEVPLDYNAGAGILHCLWNYGIMYGGEMTPGATNVRAAWDFGLVNMNQTNAYLVLIPRTNIHVSAALAWNRHVGATTNFQDLNLKLYSVSNGALDVLVDWSTSQVDSVEHIFWPSSSTGLYALAVDGGRLTTAEPYGIAFNLVAPTNSPLADADVDGVPDAFETAHFGEIYFYEADGDPDGDGAGNYNEYMADTLPTNSNSVFSIEALQVTNETLVLTFGSSTGRQYKIDYSDNFLSTNSSAWMEATTNWFPGNGSATNWVDDGSETDPPPSETTGRVYRAKVSLR